MNRRFAWGALSRRNPTLVWFGVAFYGGRGCIGATSSDSARKENGVISDDVADVASLVGNLIRIALVVRPDEIEAACVAADQEPLDTLLIDPHRSPQTRADELLNRRMMDAFRRFRLELEQIRRGLDPDSTPHA